MTNPFDDENGTFMVLINSEDQYSLWPAHLAIPPGWQVRFSDNTRQACMEFIDANWFDMRPRSLIDADRPSEPQT